MKKRVKKYFIYNLIIYLLICCTSFIFAEDSENTAKIGSNEYTWYNLPEGLKPQEVPSSEHIKETKSMKSTVYGLFGDIASGSCSYGVAEKDGYKYCKDQLDTSYGITPKFDQAAEKKMIPRVVATAYAKNGNKFEIPRGTLIYVKSNVSGVEDYGYAIVADTGGAVEKGELDLYMPYAANNTKKDDAEKFNYGLDYRQLLKLDKSGSITVYITKYNLAKDKYIYMVPKGTIIEDSDESNSSTTSSGINKKTTYSTQKSVSTSGTKPAVLTTNCKDAVSEYWTKTTTLEGDGALSSGGDANGSTLMPGDENTVTTMAGTFPKYRQGSPSEWASWAFVDDTISWEGCGPTSLAIILSGLGLLIPGYDGATLKGKSSPKDGFMTPPEVCAYSLKVGGATGDGAMYHSFPGKVASAVGVEIQEFGSGQAAQVLELLKQGYCGAASCGTGFFTGNGHIIAVVGANPDDGGKTIGIVDPNSAARDGFYTVDQLNDKAAMPSGIGRNGRTNANIGKWWIFKYKNPNTGTTPSSSSAANYGAKKMPAGKSNIDKALDSMDDTELMARLIHGEQAGNSYESQVLVGISILNRGKVKDVAKSKYSNGRYYQYNCVEGSLFWGAIPDTAAKAAKKAMDAKKSGTYKVVDCRSNTSVEGINVYGFKAGQLSSLGNKWNGWTLQVVLKNKAGSPYTGYYVR